MSHHPGFGPEDAEAAFSFLGDGLRLSILRSLADHARDAGPAAEAMAYSDLRRAVDEEDSGKFSYHLGKLTGRFVEQVPGGYRLREPGREAIRLLERGAVSGDASLSPTTLDRECPLCGASVRVVYGDHHLYTTCTDCAGLFGEGCPEGTLTGIAVPPATVGGREPDELFVRAHRLFERRLWSMFDGLCVECGGDVHRRLDRCDSHEHPNDGVCPACNAGYPALASLVCDTCGRGRVSHPLFGRTDAPRLHDLLAAAGTDDAWERFAVALSWEPIDREDGAVAFRPPDGVRVGDDRAATPIVDPDLTLRW
ncbi:hypothetical protein Hbl1158_09800 [Halobaculum sp. CBA1158]|uniref:DUF7351 domain-containing protein n=1 Tax=Halobaculum sp. CBA1158 TaxID=2904243 RepID=UPI001F19915D|nr:hypothetical protein [Halobaculum sp. CBA1158]UIO98830.1 hypothetical protein Hbl1158_09800 [Halobaculum sp. CBA1158]